MYILHDGIKVIATVALDQKPVEYYSKEDVSHFKDKNAKALYISALAVDPGFHGQGIASTLLHFAEQEARKRGLNYVRFDCRAEYKDLVHFYVKRGYKKTGTFSEGQGQNYLLMEKEL